MADDMRYTIPAVGAGIRLGQVSSGCSVVQQQQQQHVLRVSPEDSFYSICLFQNSQLSNQASLDH